MMYLSVIDFINKLKSNSKKTSEAKLNGISKLSESFK